MIHPPQVRPEEPIAVTPHDGICGGESQQWLSYPTNLHVRVCEGRGWQHPRLLGNVDLSTLSLPSRARFAAAFRAAIPTERGPFVGLWQGFAPRVHTRAADRRLIVAG